MVFQLPSVALYGILLYGVVAWHLFALFIVYSVDDLATQIIVLCLSCILAFVAWYRAFKRYHLIGATPTARITSAPQGYIELSGKAALFPGEMVRGLPSAPPCVWYRYRVYRTDGAVPSLIDSGQSHETFLLVDETGHCVIDPDLAEIISSLKVTVVNDYYRTKLEYLAPGKPLYALGYLQTLNAGAVVLDRNADISALMGEWKRDTRQLLERFDTNNDGEIDLEEWKQARKQAGEQIAREHKDIRQHADTHIMRAPKDGRPYILADRDPKKIANYFLFWAWIQAIVAVSVFAYLGTLLQQY